MKRLRVLMASWEEVAEPIIRGAIEEGGHQLTIMSPWRRELEFLEEAKTGQYDVILLTNLGLPWDFVRRLIAPCSQAGNAKVIVMSGFIDEEIRTGASREGAVGFYPLPLHPKQILGAVEAAAEGAVIIV
jgi:DNA-binding NarL/FixJ family response regulator